MDKAQVQKALEELKKQPKKKFVQSYDLIINLKNLSLKSAAVDVFVTMPHAKGRKINVAAFADAELREQAQQHCHLIIQPKDFPEYADPKKQKKLAKQCDYFIAQASLMPKIAQMFGKTLGIRGKMPNPKLGCVVPPNAQLEPLVKKLGCTARLQAKKGLNLQCLIGKENQPDEEIIDNVLAAYQAVVRALPNEFQNVKNVQLKLTMSKPVKV